MRLELEGVQASGNEWRERCSTTIQAAGAYVIVVETVLLGRGVALSSCYLAGLSGSTAVSHLQKVPKVPAAFSQRLLAVMPGECRGRLKMDKVEDKWTLRGHSDGDSWTIRVEAGRFVLFDGRLRGRPFRVCELDREGARGIVHLSPTAPRRRAPGLSIYPQAQCPSLFDSYRETHARACLLDHAAELRGMLDPDGEEAVSVEVSDAALAHAAGVWSS
jgi:hypothetical protein